MFGAVVPVALFLLSCVAGFVTAAPRADSSYTYYPGLGYYKYNPNTVTWQQAWMSCYSENAHLLVINSREERDLITSMIADNGSPSWTHIGFHRLFSTDNVTFVTVDDQRLDTLPFMEWLEGEPNNLEFPEECGAVYRNGLINDYGCRWLRPFICEI